jgi:predicted nucleotidyltransferase
MKRPSGRFLLRISPDLHRRLRDRAARQGISLNRLCAGILEAAANPREGTREIEGEITGAALSSLVERCRSVFGQDLLGLVIFGSMARGEEFPDSDVDILVIVDRRCRLRRSLYERWANEIEPVINDPLGRELSPHFCYPPSSPEEAGGLWLEVSIDGVVLWERDAAVSRHLRAIRRYLASGGAMRRIQHGHGYWVRRGARDERISA